MAEAEAAEEAPYTQLGGADGGDEEALFTALDGAGWAGRSEETRRAWSGRLLEFWGDGSVRDWQLCALSCFCAPCVWGCALGDRSAGGVMHVLLASTLRMAEIT